MKSNKSTGSHNESGATYDASNIAKSISEDRGRLLACVWGGRKVTRLNKVLAEDYCGKMTVRELAALALADAVNFPKGIDTLLCIGDFEGNFCTNVLSITTGGAESDHMCVMGDPHGCME